MKTRKIFCAALFLCSALLFQVSSNAITSPDPKAKVEVDQIIIPNNSGQEYLDTESQFLLAWNIDLDKETIYFEVTAETKGYVGFGISPNGGMTGADILIAGVNQDGSMYSSDRHGVGNKEPEEDTHANWIVTFAEETENHTTLHFHRLLNTCDNQDFRITDSTMRVIWALGETDTIAYHDVNKGTKSVNFFLKDESEFEPEKYETFDITRTMTMPAQHTAYWCSINKLPLFSIKQHVVAFEAVLEDIHAIRHTHHFSLYRCIAPEGQDPETLFGPWTSHEGDFCFDQQNATFPFLQYCNGNWVYVWTKGGKRLEFPQNLGLPIPEHPGQEEYYALEIHYDNPESLGDISFKTGARIFYTPELREEEVGLIVIDSEYRNAQLTIPPKSEDFIVVGHCSAGCTQKFLPEDGVTLFNNLFHAHLTGRKLKLRHFRGNEELPWLDDDPYYDFDFQQSKELAQVRKLERGDQLTVECTHDTRGVDGGKIVVGGLGTREEMCEAMLYYYPKQQFDSCFSGTDMDKHFELLGVSEYKTKESEVAGGLAEYEIILPENLAGDYMDSISFKINWTEEFRQKFHEEKRYGDHIGFCDGGGRKFNGPVKYPENLKDYVPVDECIGVTQQPPECEGCGAGVNAVEMTFFGFWKVFGLVFLAKFVFGFGDFVQI